MGYSLSVRFGSQDERDRMLAFLVERQSRIDEVVEVGDRLPVRITEGSILAYPPRVDPNLLIGVSVSLITFEAWAIIAWAASRSSYRRMGFAVMFVDDERKLVRLCEERPPPSITDTCVDKDGVMYDDASILTRWLSDRNRVLSMIRQFEHEWQEAVAAKQQ